MFAHQVLEDLGAELTELAPYIKGSTKYHFGHMIKSVYEVLKPMIESYEKQGRKFEVFRTYLSEIISPFNETWFEWFTDDPHSPKAAMLLLKESAKDPTLTMYYFGFRKDINKWDLFPIRFGVDMRWGNVQFDWMKDKNELHPEFVQHCEEKTNYVCSGAYLGLLFLNCRNVKTCKQRPAVALQKKRKKRNKFPLFTYHILEIKDVRKRSSKTDDRTDTTSKGKLRLHHMPARIVFYTKEKPLFGNPKNTGLIAFTDYWRGNPDKGIIIRDYKTKEDI